MQLSRPTYLSPDLLVKLRSVFSDIEAKKKILLQHCVMVAEILKQDQKPADPQLRARIDTKLRVFAEKAKEDQLLNIFKEVVTFFDELKDRQMSEGQAINALKRKHLKKLNKEEVFQLAGHFATLALIFPAQKCCNEHFVTLVKERLKQFTSHPDERPLNVLHEFLKALSKKPIRTEAPAFSPFVENLQRLNGQLAKLHKNGEAIKAKFLKITPENYSPREWEAQAQEIESSEKELGQIAQSIVHQQIDLSDEMHAFERSIDSLNMQYYDTIDDLIDNEKIGESVAAYYQQNALLLKYSTIDLSALKAEISVSKTEVDRWPKLIKEIFLLLREYQSGHFSTLIANLEKLFIEAKMPCLISPSDEVGEKILKSIEIAQPKIAEYERLFEKLKEDLQHLRRDNSHRSLAEIQSLRQKYSDLNGMMTDIYLNISRLNILENIIQLEEEFIHHLKMLEHRFNFKDLFVLLSQCKTFVRFKSDYESQIDWIKHCKVKNNEANRLFDEICEICKKESGCLNDKIIQKQRSLDALRIQLVGLNQSTITQILGSFPELYSNAKNYFDSIFTIIQSVDVSKDYAEGLFNSLKRIIDLFIDRLNNHRITSDLIKTLNLKLRESAHLQPSLDQQIDFLNKL